MTDPIRIASRSSKLALWQANTVGKMLNHEYEIVQVSTSGDERVNAISGWLQGGMQDTLAEQLVLVEKEFGISATSQKTDEDKNDTTAGGQSLCL